MIPSGSTLRENAISGWQNKVQGTNLAVAGSLAYSDLHGDTGANSALKQLQGAGALSTGTYYYFIPTAGCSAVDVTLMTSAATGTGGSSAVTLVTTVSDNVTAKGTPGAFGAFVNGTPQTVSIATLRGERGCLLKIVVPGASSVTFSVADYSAL